MRSRHHSRPRVFLVAVMLALTLVTASGTANAADCDGVVCLALGCPMPPPCPDPSVSSAQVPMVTDAGEASFALPTAPRAITATPELTG